MIRSTRARTQGSPGWHGRLLALLVCLAAVAAPTVAGVGVPAAAAAHARAQLAAPRTSAQAAAERGTAATAAPAERASAAGASAATPAATPSPTTTPRQKPNVVVVYTDDQRFDDFRPEVMPRTFREIGGLGVRFDNNVVVNSWCCPSRATLLSGNYSHTTGVYANAGKFGGEAFDEKSSLATWLQAAGYRTALIGKYFNHTTSSQAIPPGWDRFFAITDLDYHVTNGYYDYSVNDQGIARKYGHRPQGYATDVLNEKVQNFIAGVQRTRPFFAYVAPTAPHGPSIPADRHRGALSTVTWPIPPNLCEKDPSDKPAFFAKKPLCGIGPGTYLDVRRNVARPLLAVDDLVGNLIDTLKARGQLENTIFVFASDNGMSLYEHNMRGKEVVYEESVKVPLAIRFDRLGAAARGRVVTDLSANVDLAPTIADLAGVPRPRTDGVTLRPELLGTGPARGDVLIEHLEIPSDGTDEGGPTFCALRRSSEKYVYHRTGERELYDLADDPYELRNLLHDPTDADLTRAAAMHARLAELCRPAPPDPRFTLPAQAPAAGS